MKGWPSTIAGVAQAYEDFLDVLIVDRADEAGAPALNGAKLRVLCTSTIMKSWTTRCRFSWRRGCRRHAIAQRLQAGVSRQEACA